MQRISPQFVVQLLSSEKPVETVITINVGSDQPLGHEATKDWQALLDAVEAALKVKETAADSH
jgi:succinylglutamate desuccinylase